jgi:hypothetical protein
MIVQCAMNRPNRHPESVSNIEECSRRFQNANLPDESFAAQA